MAVRQYIGARYVPQFYENSDGTVEWRSGVAYEALTIVSYNGNSYTSKKTVPANIGDPSANPDYWASTGIYNVQIDEYRQETADVKAKSEKSALTNCRMVFVGDSYAAGYAPSTGDVPANGWSQVIKSTLGLSDSDCYAIYRGGAGFSSERPGGGYAAMLTEAADDITNKSEIDYVVCGGGHNDISSGDANIRSGIRAFYQTARALFPNAKIMYGMIAWDRNGTTQNQINALLRKYIEYGQAEAPEMAYMNGVENILYRVSSYLDTDGIHPSPAGNKALAAGIMNAMQTGGVTTNGVTVASMTPESGITIESGLPGGFSCSFYNGLVRLQSLKVEFNLGSYRTISGNTGQIDLASISGVPRLTNESGFTTAIYLPVLCRVANDASGTGAHFEYLNVGIGFLGGKIKLTFYEMNSAGSNWRTLYIDRITIPQFEIYIGMHN